MQSNNHPRTGLLTAVQSRRLRRYAMWMGGAFVVYSLTGFLLLPAILKSQLLKQLPSLTHRTVEVRQVRVNPWTMSLTLRGLQLLEKDGTRFAGWEELHVNFQASSLFRWAWTFDQVRLQQPYGAAILHKDGRFNFANLFPPSSNSVPVRPSTAGPERIPRVHIFHLAITNGWVNLQDQTRRRPFQTDYRPINVVLTEFKTHPGQSTPYSFRAENDSGKVLAWAGDVQMNPFASRGTIEVIGADPAKYQPYLEDYTSAEVTGGKAHIRADYRMAADTNGLDLVVSNASVRVVGLALRDPASGETVLRMPTLSIEGASATYRDRAAAVDRLTIDRPELAFRLDKDGALNWLKLLVSPTLPLSKSPDSPIAPSGGIERPWMATIHEMHLQGGDVAFADLSLQTPFSTRLKPVDLSIKHLTTATNQAADVVFSMKTEMEESISGTASVSLFPATAAGEVRLADIRLPKYWPYAQPWLRGGIQEGQLNVTAPFRVALAEDKFLAGVSNVSVQVTNLQIIGPGSNEQLVRVSRVSLEGVAADLQGRSARVARLHVTGAGILARRDSNGRINLLNMLPEGGSTGTSAVTPRPSEDPALPWSAVVDELAIEGADVVFEDATLRRPATNRVSNLNLAIKQLTTQSNQPCSLEVSLHVNQGGRVTVQGQAGLFPLSAELTVGVEQLDLSGFQPYIDQHARLTLASGSLGMGGRARYQIADRAVPELHFEGNLSVSNLQTTDQIDGTELVRWRGLDLDRIDFTFRPEALRIGQVRLDGFHATARMLTNQQMNFLTVLPADSSTGAVPPPVAGVSETRSGASGPLPFSLAIQDVILTNAAFRFVDESIEPNCVFQIPQFGGVVSGLSSDPGGTATLDIRGQFDEQAPFSILGRVNPLASALQADIAISNANLQLQVFTPYMEKFAGYPLNKGRVSVGLHYRVQDNALDAQNKVQVEQLMLGQRNQSPEATKLPVKLAVALLKDTKGVIDLDIPVSGRLDDPSFGVGKVILQVVGNLMTKAATSPFKLLGSLVGGGEELSFVDFQPGSTAFLESETNKLAKLATALSQRPALNLEIEAAIDPVTDRDVLARQKLRASLKEARLLELANAGQRPDQADFVIEDANFQRLLRAGLVREFGTNVSEALQNYTAARASAHAAAATNRIVANAQMARPRGILRTVYYHLPIHGKNTVIGAAKRQAKADAALLKQNPELAAAAEEDLEGLLASRIEVSGEEYLRLMEDRTKAVQSFLMEHGQIAADRLYRVAPKLPAKETPTLNRATLTLN